MGDGAVQPRLFPNGLRPGCRIRCLLLAAAGDYYRLTVRPFALLFTLLSFGRAVMGWGGPAVVVLKMVGVVRRCRLWFRLAV